MRIAWLVYSYEMRIYYAIRRQAVATLSHVRSCTLLRVFLAFLVLLVSTHFDVTDNVFHKLFRKIEKLDATMRCSSGTLVKRSFYENRQTKENRIRKTGGLLSSRNVPDRVGGRFCRIEQFRRVPEQRRAVRAQQKVHVPVHGELGEHYLFAVRAVTSLYPLERF